MSIKTVLIITKTKWSEPPRIRHQVTKLLINNGYEVIFIEKNTYKSILLKSRKEDGIQFFSHAELIHHQLRYFPLLQRINNRFERLYLKKISKLKPFDIVINFCYDYSFLKNIFPDKKVITVINDDFEEQAKYGMKTQIRNQLRKTCINSDNVLTVSYPLFDKLKAYKNNVQLFLPWSNNTYSKPKELKVKRNTVLYFGFISRLDWSVVYKLIEQSHYNVRFIWPTVRKSDEVQLEDLKRFNNFDHISFQRLEELNVDDVFCSISPYDPHIRSVQACTVSNRAFNLLSLGIPLVYGDLKHIIKAPDSIIRTNKNIDDYNKSLKFYFNNYYKIQYDIKLFLESHYQDNRWKILHELIKN